MYYAIYDNGKNCSNTFDVINCIGLKAIISLCIPFIMIISGFDSQSHYETETYCIDDLIEPRKIQIKIEQARSTALVFILSTVFAIIAFIVIVIAQLYRRRLYRLAIRYMPDSEMTKFVKHYEKWKISSRRLHIDYSHCIGMGSWSKVYLGLLSNEVFLFNINNFNFSKGYGSENR